ncbi:MAG: hypothetical protein AB7F64_01650 [Gammaproteobacteria bacterium]
MLKTQLSKNINDQVTSAFEETIDQTKTLLDKASYKSIDDFRKAYKSLIKAAAEYYQPLSTSADKNKMPFFDFIFNVLNSYFVHDHQHNVERYLSAPEKYLLTSVDMNFLKLLRVFNHYFTTTLIKEEMIACFTRYSYFELIDKKRFLKRNEDTTSIDDKLIKKHIPTFTNHAFLLIILYKKQLLKNKNIHWNVDIVDSYALKEYLDKPTKEAVHPNEVVRKQVIIYGCYHFVTLDMYITCDVHGKHQFEVILLDSNNGPIGQAVLHILKKHPNVNQVYYSNTSTQADEYSCALFAYDIAKNLYKEPDLLTLVKTHSDVAGIFDYTILPPRLLKNIQFLSRLDALPEDTKAKPFNKKGETLQDYISRHAGFFSDKQADKLRNLSTIDKYHSLCEIMLKILEKIPDDDIPKILSGEKPLPSITAAPSITICL